MSGIIYQPFRLASGIELKNRVVMGSMHLGLEELPQGNVALAHFYRLRARGGAGLIITGGIAPNKEGVVAEGSAILNRTDQVSWHKVITTAVHDEGGKICLQILHTGRYALSTSNVAPSALRAPINPFKPRALSHEEILQTIQDYVNTAILAKEAGYDGVEIMGSEGYLINQFSCNRTNHRDDDWGGNIENRTRLAKTIVKETRRQLGNDFIIVYRQSMLDLVEDGNTWDEILYQVKEIEAAGADIINTGIGWHEARIPTIAGVVPEHGFLWVTSKIRPHLKVPVIATNRFNDMHDADQAIFNGHTDLVSMARPFLADPDLVVKSHRGQEKNINTCIACNQACLDHVFQAKPATCLVNPEAGRELKKSVSRAKNPYRIAVVGAGPGGLSFASFAARAGHKVILYEKSHILGGQFIEAQKIPGKEVYKETIRYYRNQLLEHKVDIRLNHPIHSSTDLMKEADILVWAAGVRPRIPIEVKRDAGAILTYRDVLRNNAQISGDEIALIGGGGIAVDLAHFLLHDDLENEESFYDFWGIDKSFQYRGGLKEPVLKSPKRKITIFKRSKGKLGKGLGKTTAWIYRLFLKKYGVEVIEGIDYNEINSKALRWTKDGEEHKRSFDQVILCAGQESVEVPNELRDFKVFTIGGAKKASGLDAQRAIEEAYALALELSA
jgi:2,4-dienoyl-CoA reductase (NADPH2)